MGPPDDVSRRLSRLAEVLVLHRKVGKNWDGILVKEVEGDEAGCVEGRHHRC